MCFFAEGSDNGRNFVKIRTRKEKRQFNGPDFSTTMGKPLISESVDKL